MLRSVAASDSSVGRTGSSATITVQITEWNLPWIDDQMRVSLRPSNDPPELTNSGGPTQIDPADLSRLNANPQQLNFGGTNRFSTSLQVRDDDNNDEFRGGRLVAQIIGGRQTGDFLTFGAGRDYDFEGDRSGGVLENFFGPVGTVTTNRFGARITFDRRVSFGLSADDVRDIIRSVSFGTTATGDDALTTRTIRFTLIDPDGGLGTLEHEVVFG